MIVLLDNYDSFVHNLARYLRKLGAETLVVRSDAVTINQLRTLAPQAIVISPGPGVPEQAGCSIDAVRSFHGDVPILGVCLGHQAIAAVLGGRIVRAAEPMHGRTSEISHTQGRLFAGLPRTFRVCRYHSLVVAADSLPRELLATAFTSDGTIMAIEHVSAPTFGVQFHPEAILTEQGYPLLANFLRLAGIAVLRVPDRQEEATPEPIAELPMSERPFTF